MISTLLKLIDKLGLSQYSDTLLQMSKPSIELHNSSDDITIGSSKFGGVPDVPEEFQWPRHQLGDYRFLGQFNLAELPMGSGSLPTSGLLSLFHAHDDRGEIYEGDPHYVRAYYFSKTVKLRPQRPPEPTEPNSEFRISFELNADVPPWPWDSAARAIWPMHESFSEAYWTLRCELHPSGHYLLGFPFNSTLAYDPTPGAGWTSLLTLCSEDAMGWNWADGDWLVTFIEEAKLKQSDFTNIAADAG